MDNEKNLEKTTQQDSAQIPNQNSEQTIEQNERQNTGKIEKYIEKSNVDKKSEIFDNDKTQAKSNIVEFDKEKIDKVLDSFLRQQEEQKEKQEKRIEKAKKRKKFRKLSKFTSVLIILFFIIGLVAINPGMQRFYEDYIFEQTPKEEYVINYNYSPGIKIAGMSNNIVIYDSSDIKLMKKDGSEIFSIPFVIGSWDMETSKDRIYILDKIANKIYFIDNKGNFINEFELDNIPNKIYSGEEGNLAVHYTSKAGVEGVKIFNKNGNLLQDTNYPKTTIMFVNVNKNNEITVNGMNRVENKISNYLYRYSPKGKLEYTKVFEDVIFVKQYENNSVIALVDVNNIQFYNKVSGEVKNMVESAISAKLISYDEKSELIYVLDKRNKLRIINMEGEVIEEQYFQSEYSDMSVFKGNLVLVGEDYIRTLSRYMKYQDKLKDTFILGEHFVIITKSQIKMTNKME